MIQSSWVNELKVRACISLERWLRRDPGAHVSVFQRLSERQFIFEDWAGHRGARCEGFDADEIAPRLRGLGNMFWNDAWKPS